MEVDPRGLLGRLLGVIGRMVPGARLDGTRNKVKLVYQLDLSRLPGEGERLPPPSVRIVAA